MKSTPINLTILGNGKGELAPSFLLSKENTKFLFNFPEGIQRLFIEYKFKLPKLNRILFTSKDWNYCGGYHCAYSIYFQSTFSRIPVHSPKEFLPMLENCELLPPGSLSRIGNKWTTDEIEFDDSGFHFKPIVLSSNGIKTISYVIKMPTFDGKFDVEKADKLGVLVTQRGDLMKGKPITLKDGMVIKKEDVCSKPVEAGTLGIIHLPTLLHFEQIVSLHNLKELNYIAFIVSNKVKESIQFKQFISEYQGKPFVCLDRIELTNLEITETNFNISNLMYNCLNTALPTFTNKLNFQQETEIIKEECGIVSSLHSFCLYPKFEFESLKRSTVFKVPQISSSPLFEGNKFKVMLIGTGGAEPGKFRNVSCNVIQFKNKTIIIDIGETNTYHLIQHGINPNQVNGVYLTHGHCDHIYGLISLVKWKTTKEPLLVVGPDYMKDRIIRLCKENECDIEYINNDVFSLNYLGEDKEEQEIKIQKIFGCSITTYLLDHYGMDNYGLRIETKEFSIVFSGDTRPCENVKKLCYNVDYVVHECNYDDSLEKEAIERQHSTASLIDETLNGCNVKIVILNHIGQRTKKFAEAVKKNYKIPMIYGFDGMIFDDSIIKNYNHYKETLGNYFSLNEEEEE